ncbi:MAG: TOBE domain-containing protein, partial [Candidatus Hadarchaeales archaeon]
ALVEDYRRMREALEEIVREKTFWEDISTKLSARNRLKGVIKEVELGEIGAKVKIAVEPSTLTAYITREAADALELKEGDRVLAVIKATEVMVAKP